jgi:hypothetical protein
MEKSSWIVGGIIGALVFGALMVGPRIVNVCCPRPQRSRAILAPAGS